MAVRNNTTYYIDKPAPLFLSSRLLNKVLPMMMYGECPLRNMKSCIIGRDN